MPTIEFLVGLAGILIGSGLMTGYLTIALKHWLFLRRLGMSDLEWQMYRMEYRYRWGQKE